MNYKEHINTINIKDLDLIKYLEESLKSDKEYCKGWDYLKTNLTEDLKSILLNKVYQDITYNASNTDFILNQLYTTEEINNINKELVKQLGSFVYVWKDIKREIENKLKEEELKERLLKEGFKEVEFLKYKDNEKEEDFNKRKEEYYKPLDSLKVKCVFDKDKIGVLGSFTRTEEHIGKLIYNDKNMFFLPKGNRTRGQIIIGRFFYKEVLK